MNSLVVYFGVKTCHIWKGNVAMRSEIDTENMRWFPRVPGYKRSDIKEVDIKGFRKNYRVYSNLIKRLEQKDVNM